MRNTTQIVRRHWHWHCRSVAAARHC